MTSPQGRYQVREAGTMNVWFTSDDRAEATRELTRFCLEAEDYDFEFVDTARPKLFWVASHGQYVTVPAN
ncbi:MAG: hypothetical protein H0U60_13220 [Blastocatellia bacterium]|nr:hypothetical protein [Blastocatellia bacterium]